MMHPVPSGDTRCNASTNEEALDDETRRNTKENFETTTLTLVNANDIRDTRSKQTRSIPPSRRLPFVPSWLYKDDLPLIPPKA